MSSYFSIMKMMDTRDIRLRLKTIMTDKGVSNKELAYKADVTEQKMSKVLHLENPQALEIELFLKICDALNVTPNDVIYDTPPPIAKDRVLSDDEAQYIDTWRSLNDDERRMWSLFVKLRRMETG